MKKLLLIIFCTCIVSACQLQTAQQEPQAQRSLMSIADPSQVPRVTLAEAKAHFDDESAYFVDSRGRIEYEEQHIAGAYYLPIVGLKEHLDELPKDKLVIAYCT